MNKSSARAKLRADGIVKLETDRCTISIEEVRTYTVIIDPKVLRDAIVAEGLQLNSAIELAFIL